MVEYKRLTDKKVEGTTERYVRVDKDYILSAYDIIDEEKQDWVEIIINRLAELEDKIESGDLRFVNPAKKKYWAVIGYRNFVGQWGRL